MKKSEPMVIGISGITGAGKSTLVNALKQKLNATALFWDDYDDISTGPKDYVQWFESGRNYNEWVYDDLAETLKKLKSGESVTCPATKKELTPTEFILFDAPLGFCHQATGRYIDFLICLDTPPDIALARRLLRDYQNHESPDKIFSELEHYLGCSRPLFLLTPEEKKCDLLIDGSMPFDVQLQKVLTAIQGLKENLSDSKALIEIRQQAMTSEIKKQIFDGFQSHAISMTGHDEKFESVAFLAYMEDQFIGAVVVESFWGALHIKYVFVDEKYRGQKLGFRLMEKAMTYGQELKCPFAFVETMSFQALGFYQKMGFQLEFTRSGYLHGTSFHYLRKDL